MGCGRMIGPYECCSVVCCDCLEAMKQLPDGCVDAVITDPPYGIGFGAKHTKWSANRGVVLGSWDSAIPDVSALLPLAERIAIWGGERFSLPVKRGWLTWVKPDAAPTFASTEYAWTSLDRPARHFTFSVGEMNQERIGHPTQKPLDLMLWTIQQVAPEAETILDPFCGSGTTLVAAKKLGRHFLGFEISETYVEIARKRLAAIDAQPSLFEQKPEQLGLIQEAAETSSTKRVRVRDNGGKRQQGLPEDGRLSTCESNESGGCDVPR